MSKLHLDQKLMNLKELFLGKLNESFSLGGRWCLELSRKVGVPNIDGLRNKILEEALDSCNSIYPVLTKIYHGLREVI